MAPQAEQQSNKPSQQHQQAQQAVGKKPTSTRGFAAMDAEKHKKVSAEGGRASQQQQHNARQAQQSHQPQSNIAGNFSQQNKQESSTESAASNRSVSNQSTGLNKSEDFDKDL